jgi:hypothetical protein
MKIAGLYQFNINKMKIVVFLICICHGMAICQGIDLILTGKGFVKPVDISSTYINGDSRLFITEKDGRIQILQSDGKINGEPFLDIKTKINASANERGLLGLCFHPDYKTNGYFFVNYTNLSGHSTIARYKVRAGNPDLADASSEKIIIVVNQPFNNHNAGDLVFGPDGYLYIGMGDGGSGGDPGNRAQNPRNLLGKMLRLDVNTDSGPYLIPNDNPYKNSQDTLPEIWAMGLRNPWRYSIDETKKELWIADVGQDEWEEINVVPVGAPKLNYGWRCLEGLANFNTSGCNLNTSFTKPVFVYRNVFETGCSVTGGFVYRGSENKSLEGKYIYTDFCTGKIWALYQTNNGTWINDLLLDGVDMEYVSFGEDHKKELYLASLASGEIHRIKQKSTNTADLQAVDQIRILENPVFDMLRISLDNLYLNDAWQIVDINAKVIAKGAINTGQEVMEVEISHIPPGLYTFMISSKRLKPVRFVKIF